MDLLSADDVIHLSLVYLGDMQRAVTRGCFLETFPQAASRLLMMEASSAWQSTTRAPGISGILHFELFSFMFNPFLSEALLSGFALALEQTASFFDSLTGHRL